MSSEIQRSPAGLDLIAGRNAYPTPGGPLAQSAEQALGSSSNVADTPRRLPPHIPALDGIRGVAVLLVVFCHAVQHDPTALTGAIDSAILAVARLSWTGVDLFFVLSGFLITGILFDAKGKELYFRNFYARRTVRIFPLYYTCLILFLVLLPLLPAAFTERFGHYYTSQTWYWLYLSNYSQSIMRQFGYVTDHLVNPSWSLAIEEQFYICWPLVVFFCRRETLLKICAGMFFGSMLIRVVLELLGLTYVAMNFTPCRVDGLAVGAAIALIARGPRGIGSLVRPAKIVTPLAVVAIAVLLVVMKQLGYRRGPGYSPGYVMFGTTLFSLIFGSILVLALNAVRGTRIHRIFTHPILTAYGKYSYAVYLLHLPIIILVADFIFFPTHMKVAGTHLPGLLIFTAITFTLSLLVALASWNLLEKHFLKLKAYFPMEAQR